MEIKELCPEMKAFWETFVTATGKPAEDIAKSLEQDFDAIDDKAVAALRNEQLTPDLYDTLVKAGVKKSPAHEAVLGIRNVPAPAPAPSVVAENTQAIIASLLPELPAGTTAITEVFRTGGILKTDKMSVLAAMKVWFASKFRVFDALAIIANRIEEYADHRHIKCGPKFYEINALVGQRVYGEILAAIGAKGGHVITPAREKKFLTKMDTLLPVLSDFQNTLAIWDDDWMKKMQAVQAGQTTDARVAARFRRMTTAPDTAPIRALSKRVFDAINVAMSGTSEPVALGLGYEAEWLKEKARDPEIPAATGYPDFEAMCDELNLGLDDEVARRENAMAQYVLAIMNLDRVPPTLEADYLGELRDLGNSIPFDKLFVKPPKVSIFETSNPSPTPKSRRNPEAFEDAPAPTNIDPGAKARRVY